MMKISANKQSQTIFNFASQHVKGPSHSIDVKIEEPKYPGDG